jgi:hypothetical protein
MAAAIWGTWGEEWALNEKVSFNGVARQIVVNEGVTSLDIRADVYSAWVRWVTRETNIRFLTAIRTSGADPIPGGETGVTLFLLNNWKLCYDPNEVAVSGVLYSDDYPTAFWSLDGAKPLYPATVSALVNSAVSVQNVVTGDVGAVAGQVRTELALELLRIVELAKLHGLVPGIPLQVNETSRVAGDVAQTISTSGTTTTVTRT